MSYFNINSYHETTIYQYVISVLHNENILCFVQTSSKQKQNKVAYYYYYYYYYYYDHDYALHATTGHCVNFFSRCLASHSRVAGTCSKGYAWADKAHATDSAHSEVECSNAGVCDRTAGVCSCFTPFTGAACQRGGSRSPAHSSTQHPTVRAFAFFNCCVWQACFAFGTAFVVAVYGIRQCSA